ncbi:MAG TPA: cytochrome b/b6 domain-containing protein [Methylocystis sp.]|nr:cytochrome b/b6 domain-containing protein [Methylocystis sp.]
MPDEAQGYSAVAKSLHWIVAAIVVALVPMGLVMTDLDHGPLQDRLFLIHESFGVSVLALMLARLAVRLRGAPAPLDTPADGGRPVSVLVHGALYLLLLLTPIVGWFALSAYGRGPSFFGLGQLPALIGKDEPLSKVLFAVHQIGGLMIAALVIIHIGGVLRHALVARDELIWRMLPARRAR